ncbi:MAG: ABC transporter permease [Bacteroidota bacterium]
MQKKYSQWRALSAMAKASFKAIMKSPQTLFFSILFPLIFVFIFGSFRDNGFTVYTLGVSPGCDTSNPLYSTMANSGYVKLQQFPDTANMRGEMEKGNIAGIVNISKNDVADSSKPPYTITVKHTNATDGQIQRLLPFFQNVSYKLAGAKGLAVIDMNSQRYTIRPYKQIDFVLPGQIGFSLLFSTLFGIAFTFFTMREQLILKRFYATPVRRINILLGVGSSRLAFQLLSVIVLILIGHFFLGFTLVHGFITILNMLFLSIILLFLLMGIGLIFSSIVKSDSTIPLLINIFCLPQILVAGTFFPIEVFPKWLQSMVQVLPLTHFNSAMRKIAFEGAGLTDIWLPILVLLAWITIVYAIAVKIFKWE